MAKSTAHTQQAEATTQQVRVAEGTLSAGFDRPVELGAGPSGSLADLQVTLSAPDVGYVVWEQQPGTRLRLSVVCNGEIVVPDRQLLSDAVPLALFPLAGGRAALVFDQYGHGTPFLEYGLLSATGGRARTIAPSRTRSPRLGPRRDRSRRRALARRRRAA